MMKLLGIAAAAGLAGTLWAAPASAELKPGARAPLFSARASLGGKDFGFDLKRALARGPVVLYFYPAAFTSGCTLEAHDFASHIQDYTKAGATVIGVSGDDLKTLDRFGVSECRSKFAVASDPDHAISKSYDAVLGVGPVAYSDRTSYVIARNGTIAYSYRSLDPALHVRNTLDALARLSAK